ncbi:helix-turn-helix transcriptional regulator [Wenjunlia tyrosinilytica]|uniref:helix-turn-helix transcriptional regulator n=1 Tax=Wenjunlia tyrosinilytica TaxID=1544741 RepID=UPI001E54089C|nr:helix-turn-helix transcriptional regulator [Wenjunlia tyrosinilytica]
MVARRWEPPSGAQSLLETTADTEAAAQTLHTLLGEAKRSVKVVLPPDGASVDMLCRALRSLSETSPGAAAVRVQVLCSREFANRHKVAECTGMRPNIDVRFTDALLHGAVLIDKQIALTQSDPDPDQGSGSHATLVRAPAVVKALNALFASAWRRAAPLVVDRIRQELSQEILRCLREGYTDEAAARELGVSVRTYRRHVAEIMRALGANSRFQAGVYASELGLLPVDGRTDRRGSE